MTNHETFQAHCLRCYARFEADTLAEAVRKVEEHEKKCEVKHAAK